MRKQSSRTSLAVLLGLGVVLTAPANAQDTLVLEVDRVHTGAGGVVSGPLVIVDGKIARIGGDAPNGAEVIDHSGKSACAGFVDVTTQLGGRGAFDEPARAVTGSVDAREAFDPFHDDFERAAQSGVTSAGLSPSSANLIGGRMAVVRTRGADDRAAAAGEGPLRMSLTRSALQPTRAPTSRMGAMHVLRAEIEAGLPGTGGIVIAAGSVDEIRLALSLLSGTGRALTLFQPTSADRALSVMEGSSARAILGPYGTASSTRALRTASTLSGRGVEVAFTAGGNGAALRLTAALAVREGMDADAALAAITSVPATILGLADTGILQPGKRADILIFDGHPLDLTADLEAVYSAGTSVELDD